MERDRVRIADERVGMTVEVPSVPLKVSTPTPSTSKGRQIIRCEDPDKESERNPTVKSLIARLFAH